MATYIGILDGKNEMWGVRMPDLEGCYGAGATPEAAIADAISAARRWAEHKQGRGIAAPSPRSVSDIVATEKPDASAGETIVMIPLLLDAGRTVRANLTIDAGLLAEIDNAAKLHRISCAQIARKHIKLANPYHLLIMNWS